MHNALKIYYYDRMNHNLDLTERNYKSYPIVIIPNKIVEGFTKEIHYEEILSFLDETYYPAKPIVFRDMRFNFFGNEKSEDFSLGQYLNLEKGDYNFMYGDFYYSNPFIPEYKLPNRPSKYKYIYVERNNNFLIGLNILINVIFFFILKNYYPLSTSLYVLLGLLSTTLVLFLLEVFKQKVSEKIKLDDEDYKNIVADFEAKVDVVANKVVNDFADYKMKKLRIVEANRELVERKIYDQLLKPIYPAITFSPISSKGRSELFFLGILYKFFDSQISVDIVPNVGNNPYQPDFLLICNKSGFHLSIEIDEPYSVENGKPIHHERTNDEKRDDFFEQINWGIVRFSEKQIIENPDECCNLIKNIINCVYTKNHILTHTIIPDRKWNYEEALIMSNTNYRNSYLPDNMKIQIRSDKAENSIDDFDLPF
jgi:hypothetical protein